MVTTAVVVIMLMNARAQYLVSNVIAVLAGEEESPAILKWFGILCAQKSVDAGITVRKMPACDKSLLYKIEAEKPITLPISLLG